jgi:hypothetical protein
MRWLQRGFLTCEQHWPFAQTPSPRLPLPQLGRKRPAVELRKPRTPLVVVVLEATIVDSSLSADNDWEGSSTTTAHDGPTTTTRAANKLKHTFLAKNMVEVFLSFGFPVPDETNPAVGKDCEPKRLAWESFEIQISEDRARPRSWWRRGSGRAGYLARSPRRASMLLKPARKTAKELMRACMAAQVSLGRPVMQLFWIQWSRHPRQT